MATTSFQKQKLDAIRSRIAQDRSAVEKARAEGDAAGYARAEEEARALIHDYREKLDLALERMHAFRAWVAERDAENSHLRVSRQEEKALHDAAKADIAILKAAVETMKAEVTATRFASREPRKAAVNEILAILKRERTVARSEAVLRNMLKEL